MAYRRQQASSWDDTFQRIMGFSSLACVSEQLPVRTRLVQKAHRLRTYVQAMFISKRDMVQAVTLALKIDKDFLLAYAISNNDSRIFDLAETNTQLGFNPMDNSADYL